MSANFWLTMIRACFVGFGIAAVDSHGWIASACLVFAFILTDYIAENEARSQVKALNARLIRALENVGGRWRR